MIHKNSMVKRVPFEIPEIEAPRGPEHAGSAEVIKRTMLGGVTQLHLKWSARDSRPRESVGALNENSYEEIGALKCARNPDIPAVKSFLAGMERGAFSI